MGLYSMGPFSPAYQLSELAAFLARLRAYLRDRTPSGKRVKDSSGASRWSYRGLAALAG
jgi:hypothetical protein